ncbi:MAG: NrfD/PsrC family molybdoenzyme membrane anchor subunit [Planctomycetota bacterium]|jgi:formate-dependent nitrite reductase membrane component NrfD
MRQVKLTSLLDVPQDGAVLQREWTTKGQHGKRGLLLEIAFFAGMVGPGLYMTSCFYGFHLGLLAGFLIVLIGYGLPHMLFLGRIWRFWRAALRPQSSWISRGFIFAGLFLAFGFLSVAHYVPQLEVVALKPDSWAFKWMLVAGSVSAFLLAMYPGFLFSVLRAMPLWRSRILIPLFLVQALGGGLSLTLILTAIPGVSGPARVEVLPPTAVAIAVTGVLIGVLLLTRRRADASSRAAVDRLLGGKYRALFLFGACVCGVLLPLLLTMLTMSGMAAAEYVNTLVVAAALAQLSGVLLFKYCLLNASAYDGLYSDRLIESVSRPGRGARGRVAPDDAAGSAAAHA